jgi:hypothetical protein
MASIAIKSGGAELEHPLLRTRSDSSCPVAYGSGHRVCTTRIGIRARGPVRRANQRSAWLASSP